MVFDFLREANPESESIVQYCSQKFGSIGFVEPYDPGEKMADCEHEKWEDGMRMKPQKSLIF